MYAVLRQDRRAPQLRLVTFRAGKDRLFAEHPSSPVPEGRRATFQGLAYWRHDEALRFSARLEPDPQAEAPDVPRSGDGPAMPFTRIGWVAFAIEGVEQRLAVYWLNEYAGGIFIPFRDATSGAETYGGGRYLWDSAQGRRPGLGRRPSWCWTSTTPTTRPASTTSAGAAHLAPQENWLTAPIAAGERLAPAP